MRRKILVWLTTAIVAFAAIDRSRAQVEPQTRTLGNIALVNGQWFNGASFERKTMYSVDGRFATAKPARIDRSIDLAGAWIVPPFAEAHNHNLSGSAPESNRATLRRYLADGVFYVKIQGNYPLSAEMRSGLPMNRPDGPDVAFAQTFLTSTDGHPIYFHESVLMARGVHPGVRVENLKNNLYFTLDSASELLEKWPHILALRPDFIKINLWCSDEFEKRRNDPTYIGRKALDPKLVPAIVEIAHKHGLRVSAHIVNSADFRHAVTAGVDELVHLVHVIGSPKVEAMTHQIMNSSVDPQVFLAAIREELQRVSPDGSPRSLISVEDAREAAKRGVVVITTTAAAPPFVRSTIAPFLAATLRMLKDSGVQIAIGSDLPRDTSVGEFESLRSLHAFDDLTLLRMWTLTTPQAIFPDRKIGELKEGYEASFLALDGSPLENLDNVRRIRMRFKQGMLLELPDGLDTREGKRPLADGH